MKINLDAPPEDVRIEIIPLIDVIFCILTFFLVAALQLTRQQAINVDLPKASSGTAQMQDMLIVTVDSNRLIYLEQQPVTTEQLTEALKNYHKTHPNGLMVLYASKTVYYEDVVQVLDLLRSIGGSSVALATIPSAPAQTPASNTVPPVTPVQPQLPNGNLPLTPYPGGTTAPVSPAPNPK